MGGPKALMLIGDRPWWRVQQRRLIDAGCAPLWVVSPQVRAALSREPDAPTSLIESDPDAPMFASLRRGVEHTAVGTPASHTFVLPVDVPAPDRATWIALAEAAGSGVAVPALEGRRGHPVCLSARWIERVLGPAVRAGDADALRLDVLIAGRAAEIAVADASVTTNLNTPDDVARWLAARA
jgi:CTP:molybdopterin cytidylyltransferase MocA